MKYNFRNTGSLSNLTRPNTEHEKMKLEQKAFQVFNDKGHLTRQLGMLSIIRPIQLLPVIILITGSDRTGSSDRIGQLIWLLENVMLLSRKMEPFSNIWIILPNSIFVLCENFEKFSLDFFVSRRQPEEYFQMNESQFILEIITQVRKRDFKILILLPY